MIDPKPYFFTLSFNDCQNLQWQLGLVWLWHPKKCSMAGHKIGAKVFVGAHSTWGSHQKNSVHWVGKTK
jgi:hypothetical protein